jgi:hypothetical protein
MASAITWKREEMAERQKTGSVAEYILNIGYQGTVGIYHRMINGWKGMTLAQKIGWIAGLLLFLAYPLMVFVHYAFLRTTF